MKDVMRKNLHFIATDFSLQRIAQMMRETNHLMYPVVNDSANMTLIGTVSRGHIELVCEEYRRISKESGEGKVLGVFNICLIINVSFRAHRNNKATIPV